jgi:hypothetical protein
VAQCTFQHRNTHKGGAYNRLVPQGLHRLYTGYGCTDLFEGYAGMHSSKIMQPHAIFVLAGRRFYPLACMRQQRRIHLVVALLCCGPSNSLSSGGHMYCMSRLRESQGEIQTLTSKVFRWQSGVAMLLTSDCTFFRRSVMGVLSFLSKWCKLLLAQHLERLASVSAQRRSPVALMVPVVR